MGISQSPHRLHQLQNPLNSCSCKRALILPKMQTDTTDMTYIFNPESQLNWHELHWSGRLPHDYVETTAMQFDSNLPVAAPQAPINFSHSTNISQQYWPQDCPSQPSSASTGQSPQSTAAAKQPQTPRGRRKL